MKALCNSHLINPMGRELTVDQRAVFFITSICAVSDYITQVAYRNAFPITTQVGATVSCTRKCKMARVTSKISSVRSAHHYASAVLQSRPQYDCGVYRLGKHPLLEV